MKKYIFLPVLATSCVSANTAITQIKGTGWNADLIVEKTETIVADTNAARLAARLARTSNHLSSFVYYETGFGTNVADSLNSTGAYSGSGTSYQLEPYTANNAFLNGGTFTLKTAAKYSKLAFLSTTQGGGIYNYTATITFADATTTVLTATGMRDWVDVNATQKVITGNKLLRVVGETPGSVFSTGGNLTERKFTLSAADQLKDITSITFDKDTAHNLAIHAISGQAVPVQPSATLLGLGGFTLTIRDQK